MLVKATFKLNIKCMQGTINKFIYLLDSCMSLFLSSNTITSLTVLKTSAHVDSESYMKLPLLFIAKNLIKHNGVHFDMH